ELLAVGQEEVGDLVDERVRLGLERLPIRGLFAERDDLRPPHLAEDVAHVLARFGDGLLVGSAQPAREPVVGCGGRPAQGDRAREREESKPTFHVAPCERYRSGFEMTAMCVWLGAWLAAE